MRALEISAIDCHQRIEFFKQNYYLIGVISNQLHKQPNTHSKTFEANRKRNVPKNHTHQSFFQELFYRWRNTVLVARPEHVFSNVHRRIADSRCTAGFFQLKNLRVEGESQWQKSIQFIEAHRWQVFYICRGQYFQTNKSSEHSPILPIWKIEFLQRNLLKTSSFCQYFT